MHIAYYDESGDDGYPQSSSPLFVLSACYLHYLNWKDCYEALYQVRQQLRVQYGIPVKMELHWKKLLTNKKPFVTLGLSDEERLTIAAAFCDALAQMNLKFINVCIVKPRIQKRKYEVLDTALTYSIQRIENDLNPTRNPNHRFMIITDDGRVGKMRTTSRRIQRINFIPSKFGQQSYRKEIRTLIEDPLPKDSRESYFIQSCDLVAYIVYLHRLHGTGAGQFHNRLPQSLTPEMLSNWLERLSPSLNLNAISDNSYGIVEYPKQ